MGSPQIVAELQRKMRKKEGEALRRLALKLFACLSYSERRKFNRFCLFVADSALKFAITVLASDPVLECAVIAVIRLLVRPSCRKKILCPRPHSGAVRNWSPPAPPWLTLSFSPVPM